MVRKSLVHSCHRASAASVLLVATSIVLAATGVAFSARKPITFMAWTTSKEDTDSFTRMCNEFMKAHPDIPVKYIAESWRGDLPYFEKYLSMATAGVAPDVVMIPFSWLPNFAEAAFLEDLTPWAKRSKLRLSDWSDAGMEASTWKGKLWGLNGGTSSDWWIQFNKKVIAESGILDPGTLAEQGNWNWESMEAIMAKTSRFDGQKLVRIGLEQMGDPECVAPWIWGMGGQVLNADSTECLLGEQIAIDAVSKIQNYILVKKIMGMFGTNYGLDILPTAKKSQFAMTAWWNTFGSFLSSNKVPWQVDMVPFPPGPKSAKTNLTEIHSMVISRQSQQKASAWEFLQFLGGPRGQEIMLQDLQGLPTRRDVIPKLAEAYRKSDMLAAAKGVNDALNRQHIWHRSTKMNLIQPIMQAALQKIWLGKADVAMALKDAAKASNAILARSAKKK